MKMTNHKSSYLYHDNAWQSTIDFSKLSDWVYFGHTASSLSLGLLSHCSPHRFLLFDIMDLIDTEKAKIIFKSNNCNYCLCAVLTKYTSE